MNRIRQFLPRAIIIASLAATGWFVWDIFHMRPPHPRVASVIPTSAEPAAPAAATAPLGAQPAKEARVDTAQPVGESVDASERPYQTPRERDPAASEALSQCPKDPSGYYNSVNYLLPPFNGPSDATVRWVSGQWFNCVHREGPL
jgi:hypothetical protein